VGRGIRHGQAREALPRRPATGIAEEVDLGGGELTSPDGLELRGQTLYVVGDNLVNVVRAGTTSCQWCGAGLDNKSGP
jgi:hypothetical protein